MRKRLFVLMVIGGLLFNFNVLLWDSGKCNNTSKTFVGEIDPDPVRDSIIIDIM